MATPSCHALQVADGADVGISVDPAMAKVHVHWPWMHLLAGQAQYELVMGFFW